MPAGFERVEYDAEALRESELEPDPIDQFRNWFAEAAHLEESNIMVLATAGADGRPTARAVLLKSFDERGFVFFTNLGSEKGRHLEQNPYAEGCFHWQPLHRQVRVRGSVSPISPRESDEYWASRPRNAQVASTASAQSSILASRSELERRIAAVEAKWDEASLLPRPVGWGGFRIEPEAIEFWQGQASRAHDRLRYRLSRGTWIIERLSP